MNPKRPVLPTRLVKPSQLETPVGAAQLCERGGFCFHQPCPSVPPFFSPLPVAVKPDAAAVPVRARLVGSAQALRAGILLLAPLSQ